MLDSRLPLALDGRRIALPGEGPGVCAYASPAALLAGDDLESAAATPLLLVHSVNASASAAEMRPLFERYGPRRPTLALELPGFGTSQRGPLDYSPGMMVQSVLRAARYLRSAGFTQPIDVLGLSLSCEFVAMAVLHQPSWFRTVALVSPTGLKSGDDERFERGKTKEQAWLRKVLTGPFGEAIYRLLTTPSSMRWFLERAWGSPVIDEALLEYEHITARCPGARFAPAAFISGALFTKGIAEQYAQIAQPVWLAHGVRGEFSDFGGLSQIGPPPNWSWDTFSTGAMPHLELPRLFTARYDAFQERVAVNAAALRTAAVVEPTRDTAFADTGAARDARRWSHATAAVTR